MTRTPAWKERVGHLVHRSGHHAWRLLFFLYILCLVMQFAPLPDRARAVILATGMAAVLFAFCFGFVVHQLKPCAACAAKMPLNGSELADKHRRWLKAFHWSCRSGWKRWAVIVVAWLGFTQLTGRLLPDNMSTVVTFIPAALSVMTIMRHVRLQFWCPYCRENGGGDRIETPTPDPGARVPA